MSFDWSEYLTLARALSGEDDVVTSKKARQRAAISRAYYAVYGTARAVARSQGYMPQRAETAHQGLIDHFKGSPDRARKAVGANLERLLWNRVSVDYESRFQGKLVFEVMVTLSLAASVLTELDNLRQS